MGHLSDVKKEYANFKCTINGNNNRGLLESLPEVERVEQSSETAVLYLSKHVQPAVWLKSLPEELDIQELSIDRISLHEIFIDIATDKNLLKEAGELHA